MYVDLHFYISLYVPTFCSLSIYFLFYFDNYRFVIISQQYANKGKERQFD